jgi:hypothetical protein
VTLNSNGSDAAIKLQDMDGRLVLQRMPSACFDVIQHEDEPSHGDESDFVPPTPNTHHDAAGDLSREEPSVT